MANILNIGALVVMVAVAIPVVIVRFAKGYSASAELDEEVGDIWPFTSK